MVLLRSLLWWELGTNLPGPGEWLSFWRVTSKHFWFWFWAMITFCYVMIMHIYRKIAATKLAYLLVWIGICICDKHVRRRYSRCEHTFNFAYRMQFATGVYFGQVKCLLFLFLKVAKLQIWSGVYFCHMNTTILRTLPLQFLNDNLVYCNRRSDLYSIFTKFKKGDFSIPGRNIYTFEPQNDPCAQRRLGSAQSD